MENYPETSIDLDAPAILQMLVEEASEYRGPTQYVTGLAQRYEQDNIYKKVLLRMGRAIEPEDLVLGIDTDMPKGVAFILGSVLGLRIMESLRNDILGRCSNYLGLAMSGSDSDDPQAARHLFATSIVVEGQTGYDASITYHDLIEDWCDSIVPDVTSQPFFKEGFGLVMNLARRTISAIDQERLGAMADAAESYDWDTELSGLLGEN
jgi:hypothetical protein